MIIFEKIQHILQKLSERQFQIFIGTVVGISLLFIALFDIQLYRLSRQLKTKIKRLNIEREDRVRDILTKGGYIKQQKEEMDRLLKEDVNFKIAGYFSVVLKKLGMARKKITETTTQTDIDVVYRESSLAARLDEMDMKELTELLQVLENNKRISIKRLEIFASTKKPNAIDVQLTIATMLLKTFSET
jgi:uncharacterized protein YlaN (UPF0358 family)